MKGYVTLDLHNHEILISRNVTFEETIFPYPPNTSKPTWEYMVPSTNTPPSQIAPKSTTKDQITTNNPSNYLDKIPFSPLLTSNPSTTNQQFDNNTNNESVSHNPIPVTEAPTHELVNHNFVPTTEASNDQPVSDSTPSPVIQPRRSTRDRKLPSHLVDYHCNSIVHKTPYPISKYITMITFPHPTLTTAYHSLLNKSLTVMRKLRHMNVGSRQ
jgi:hypothetical protein